MARSRSRFLPGSPPHPMDRYVVIGNPVSHSLSPAIHSRFAAQTADVLDYGMLLVPLLRSSR